MSNTGSPAEDLACRAGTIDYFRRLQVLHDHWARPPRQPSYYWYLTFPDAASLLSLTRTCQAAIAFPYYDLVPADRLHMTLDRVATDSEITQAQLDDIAEVAANACRRIAPFDICVGSLGGTSGAIGFNAQATPQLRQLRGALAEVSQRVLDVARTAESAFHPHVSIAYCNRDVPAVRAIAAVEALNLLPPATAKVREATLVLLVRRQRSYAWQTIAQIPLAR